MNKKIFSLPAIALFMAGALPALADTVAYDRFLTVADVESVTGLAGLTRKVGERELKFSAGTKLVLNVRFQSAKAYRLSKETPNYVQAEVTGVGEEAFCGPAAGLPYVLIFRNKDYCVRLLTYIHASDPTRPVLTLDQLTALGKIIAARM